MDSFKVDVKKEALGEQENYGYAEDVKATELFHKAKKKKSEKDDNKKSHVIYNKGTGRKCKETDCFQGKI